MVQGTQLERLEHMKDLGVIFDSELNFEQHCKEKINIAYSYLGIIKRNFIHLDKDAFVMLGLIPFRICKFSMESTQNRLLKDLENVHICATKLVIIIQNLTYKVDSKG